LSCSLFVSRFLTTFKFKTNLICFDYKKRSFSNKNRVKVNDIFSNFRSHHMEQITLMMQNTDYQTVIRTILTAKRHHCRPNSQATWKAHTCPIAMTTIGHQAITSTRSRTVSHRAIKRPRRQTRLTWISILTCQACRQVATMPRLATTQIRPARLTLMS
jgi:hypothetical protein